ncbi:short chain dehydrogenase reductase [Grosmannia clavigera kw1407]|uniref:Short chain dehydrogenase reductase n=1 Tax=Grosmannia clavigera (strain kw1407 / UAMH 11150) TaxID=655863 RepID=F0XHT8_GROCL|nr:short chain dehydrogenase reductase [Grosmannia clavigera kw1407]EFX02586.1 short chain dehydrogenase reductase [Grosmannia clavigera kw1407]
MPSYVVVGASRGLGYGFLNVLSAEKENTVIGLVRNVPGTKAQVATDFPDRKNIHIVQADLNDRATLVAAVEQVSAITGGSVDVLISNAAVGSSRFLPIGEEANDDPAAFDANMETQFRTNVLGTIHAVALFAPLVQKSQLKKIAVISSAMGDVELVLNVGISQGAPYAISKAAVNMAVAKFHNEYRDRGVLVVGISPGVVATTFAQDGTEQGKADTQKAMAVMGAKFMVYDPNWPGIPFTADEAATNVIKVITKATIKDNGGLMVSQYGDRNWL